MKSLALVVLSSFATVAMADINIDGTQTQTVSLTRMTVSNSASANNTALQNLSSNTDGVHVFRGGNSTQSVTGTGGTVRNTSSGPNAFASQNLSSNLGDVNIRGNSTQRTTMTASLVSNLASGANSRAIQNLASNNACVSCWSAPRPQ